ncbi:MAG: hypothetical protein U0667_05770 [Chloroflexota bacterium]
MTAIAGGLLLAGNLATVAPAVAAPSTVRYPDGPGDCASPHTIQECIDSVDAGSTVIVTSEILPGATTVSIDKSLTLRASSASHQPHLSFLYVAAGAGSIAVTVQDFKVADEARVNLYGGADHVVKLRRLEVGKGEANARGIEVQSSVRSTITIQDSYVRSTDNQGNAVTLYADAPSGLVEFRVVGNRITGRGNADSGSGVSVYGQGPGSLHADILSNVIWDVGRCYCGAAAGVSVLAYGAIKESVNVVGNTIELSKTIGMSQRNSLTGNGHLTLDVFDNIISHASGAAVALERGASGSMRFRAGYNAYYANGSGPGWRVRWPLQGHPQPVGESPLRRPSPWRPEAPSGLAAHRQGPGVQPGWHVRARCVGAVPGGRVERGPRRLRARGADHLRGGASGHQRHGHPRGVVQPRHPVRLRWQRHAVRSRWPRRRGSTAGLGATRPLRRRRPTTLHRGDRQLERLLGASRRALAPRSALRRGSAPARVGLGTGRPRHRNALAPKCPGTGRPRHGSARARPPRHATAPDRHTPGCRGRCARRPTPAAGRRPTLRAASPDRHATRRG